MDPSLSGVELGEELLDLVRVDLLLAAQQDRRASEALGSTNSSSLSCARYFDRRLPTFSTNCSSLG